MTRLEEPFDNKQQMREVGSIPSPISSVIESLEQENIVHYSEKEENPIRNSPDYIATDLIVLPEELTDKQVDTVFNVLFAAAIQNTMPINRTRIDVGRGKDGNEKKKFFGLTANQSLRTSATVVSVDVTENSSTQKRKGIAIVRHKSANSTEDRIRHAESVKQILDLSREYAEGIRTLSS